MAGVSRKSARRAGGHAWRRVVLLALPLVTGGLLLVPPSLANRVRAWTGPVFSPFSPAAEGWSLDLAQRLRTPSSPGQEELQRLGAHVTSLENALAEATALLAEYERRVRDLAHMRQGLDGLPCRLIPARLLAPEVAGGQAGARLDGGTEKGIARRGAVLTRAAINRGAREALERGEPLLVAAGLLGIVDEVGPYMSTVRLVTDPRTHLMVQTIALRDGQWRAGPEGVAGGSGDGRTIVVRGISRTADVRAGDFVVTSPSPESPLPPYLIVGRIARCDLRTASLFHDIEAEPRAVPSEVREVYVLSPEGAPPKP